MEKQLHHYAEQLKLSLSDHQIGQLISFMELLEKWNKAYSLSAIRGMDKILTHHILDSLAVAGALASCERVLDVGTGAGLPGLVLAICYPQHHFSLLDGNGKKIRFLVQAKHDLKINNIEPIHERAENYHTDQCFSGIISRAVGSVTELIRCTKHLLCPQGHWYAMKGNYPEAELEGLTYSYHVQKLSIPQLEGARHLVIIED